MISHHIAIAMGLAASLAAIFAPLASAQSSVERSPVRVVFLVQNPRQVETVVSTAIGMLEGKGVPADSVRIVFCGEAVTTLVAPTTHDSLLAGASARGVQLVACGISVAQKQIEAARLVPEASVVENGLLELLRLKLDGFVSIEL